MTDNERQIIIAEAQRYADYYNTTPKDPMYFDVREMFSEKYDVIATLYCKLTGKLLMVENGTVKEKEV